MSSFALLTPSRRRPRRLRGLLVSILLALLVLLGGFLLLPAPIQAVAWQTPQAPSWTGVWTVNHALSQAQVVTNQPENPEFITFDAQGRLYTGDTDGTIYQVSFAPDRTPAHTQVYARTGGSVGGLKFDAQGNLIVADLKRGLLSVSQEGQVTVLTNHVGNTPIYLANELDIARDGMIYFSDCSSYGRVSFREVLENRPTGRLLRYDPRTRTTSVVLPDLSFANGVALSAQGDFVLVVETYRYQVRRYWLSGPKAGTSDLFAQNLPGFPDNITRDDQGHFWVALFTTRVDLVDQLHRSPFLAEQLAKLPEAMLNASAAPAKHGLVFQLDQNGVVMQSLHDTTGRVFGVTTAQPHDGYLYLGTAPGGNTGLLRTPLPSAEQAG